MVSATRDALIRQALTDLAVPFEDAPWQDGTPNFLVQWPETDHCQLFVSRDLYTAADTWTLWATSSRALASDMRIRALEIANAHGLSTSQDTILVVSKGDGDHQFGYRFRFCPRTLGHVIGALRGATEVLGEALRQLDESGPTSC